MRFVDELPAARIGPRKSVAAQLRDALAKQPGRWAEVQRFEPEHANGQKAAWQRAAYLRSKGLETASRRDGDEYVVYARVTADGPAAEVQP